MGHFVVIAFVPKADQGEALLAVIHRYESVLREAALLTARPAALMRAEDRTVVAVFEWRDQHAMKEAQHLPVMPALAKSIQAVCDPKPLASLAEAHHVFAEFDALS